MEELERPQPITDSLIMAKDMALVMLWDVFWT